MSSDPSIKVVGLSKAYRVYAKPMDRLRQLVMPGLHGLAAPLLRAAGLDRPAPRYFTEHWALRELSFEVARGETIGIIGRNGSGKSTLLQLISGTLTATTGSVSISGRIASLLELGSGFNPEYTGRENVFLNASVLGLTNAETVARLDDILAFADIGDAIDQPVKSYSSGMAMRLAFSVSAHVDADVMVIDEALAVGDAYFQQKCFRWLREYRRRGSLLFCGHDIGAIMNLCDRAIWLEAGVVQMAGTAKPVAEAYSTFIARKSMGFTDDLPHPATTAPSPAPETPAAGPEMTPMAGKPGFGSGQATITHLSLAPAEGPSRAWYQGGEDVVLTLRIEAHEALQNVVTGFALKDRLGQAVAGDNSCDIAQDSPVDMAAGEVALASYRFRMPRLAPGNYALTCSVASGLLLALVQHHWLHEALLITMQHRGNAGTVVTVETQEKRFQRNVGAEA